jgi:8-oxo-dGTP pyrophosphatase MutT (NUDIX family)
MDESSQLLESAVLVPVFRGPDGRVSLLLVRRTDFGIHGGQLAFPGGKHSGEDPSMLATALRETREEVGIEESSVQVIAELPVVDTHSTGYRIYPFLGKIQHADEWWFDPREIAEVIPVAVEDLADPRAYGESVEKFSRLPEPIRISFYKVGPHRLWGATYRIVTQLIPRLLNGEWTI